MVSKGANVRCYLLSNMSKVEHDEMLAYNTYKNLSANPFLPLILGISRERNLDRGYGYLTIYISFILKDQSYQKINFSKIVNFSDNWKYVALTKHA